MPSWDSFLTSTVSSTLWEGFWGIVIFGVEIENIGNELEIDSDLQVGY